MDRAAQKVSLQQRLDMPAHYSAGRFAGAGVVICAGGAAMFTNAFVLIHVLRNALGCRLPIEVWHFGQEELSARMQLLLHELDARTVDALEVLKNHPAKISNGWQLKVYSVIHCSFEHVLLLDADNVPTRDPACVFSWHEWSDAGAILWPDVVDLLKENPVWDVCGLEPRTQPSVESGQLCIDKARCWGALQIALHLNENADFFYDLVYGDKDTWLLALLMTQSPHAMIAHRPASDGGFCLFQHDMDGRVLFQHRTRAKWRYSGVNRHVPGFLGTEVCEAALGELRAKWNGYIFNAPRRSAGALQIQSQLQGSPLAIAIAGEASSRIQFLPAGEIRSARGDCLNWHCEEEDGDVRLMISDQFGIVWRFVRTGSDRWTGQSTDAATRMAFLGPVSGAPELKSRKPEHAAWPLPGRYSRREDAT